MHESKCTVTVSLPDRKAIVQNADGQIVRTYSVFVGSERFPTLTGSFRILPEEHDLSSDVSYAGTFIPFHEYPDPEVFLTGTNDWTAVAGFHGWKYTPEDHEEESNNPGWMTSTEGCIQMTNEDIAEFAQMVRVGDTVIVLDLCVSEIDHLKPITPNKQWCSSFRTGAPSSPGVRLELESLKQGRGEPGRNFENRR